jgi:hypothetical protein
MMDYLRTKSTRVEKIVGKILPTNGSIQLDFSSKDSVSFFVFTPDMDEYPSAFRRNRTYRQRISFTIPRRPAERRSLGRMENLPPCLALVGG